MKFLYGKTNKICAVLIFILAAFINSAAIADESKIEFILGSENCGSNIIQATYGDAQLSASADGINGEKIRWDTDVSIPAPRMQGKNLATGWNVGGYWMIKFSAKNLENITLSADMFSSGKGPKTFEMYYSINGTDFNKIDNSEVTLSKTNRTVYNNFSLPDSINGEADVYIKLLINSEIGVNGNIITGLKDGSTYINNIIIKSVGKNTSTDDKKDDTDEKDTFEKSYYNKKENLKTQKLGQPTGKYKFSVKRSS